MQHIKQYSLKGFPYPLYLRQHQAQRCWQWMRDIVLNKNDILDTIESAHLASRSVGGDQYAKGVMGYEVWNEWTNGKKDKGYGLEDIPAQVVQQSLKDLEKAFDGFFSNEGGGYPHYKSPEDTFPSLRFPQAKQIEIHDGWVRLPKLGWIQFNEYRPVPKHIHSATISWDGLTWSINFLAEVENEIYPKLNNIGEVFKEVAIDRGVANSVAYDSDGVYKGEMVHWCVMTKGEKKRKRRLERQMARRAKGSWGYSKARRLKLKLEKKVARRIKDQQHKETTKLAKEVDVVYVDKLNLVGMTASAKGTIEEPGSNVAAKSGMNKSMREQAHGQFEEMLNYKMEIQGKYVIKVYTQYSSQECNGCHHIDKKNRKSQSEFKCVKCGHEAHADTNAADITKGRGQKILEQEIERIDKERAEAKEEELVRLNRKLAGIKSRSLKAKAKKEAKVKKEAKANVVLLESRERKDNEFSKYEAVILKGLQEHKPVGHTGSGKARTSRVVTDNVITNGDVAFQPEVSVRSVEKHGALDP